MKNAITVIDQELIDRIQCLLDSESLGDNHCDVRDLTEMAKDLIEINAELTKREQKYKMAMNDQIRYNIDISAGVMSYMYLEQSLKGDSDE